MENKQFRITNNLGEKISFSLEPEGTIMEVLPDDYITVELSSELNPVIDIKINRYANGICLSIWPEEGTYNVKEFQ